MTITVIMNNDGQNENDGHNENDVINSGVVELKAATREEAVEWTDRVRETALQVMMLIMLL